MSLGIRKENKAAPGTLEVPKPQEIACCSKEHQTRQSAIPSEQDSSDHKQEGQFVLPKSDFPVSLPLQTIPRQSMSLAPCQLTKDFSSLMHIV